MDVVVKNNDKNIFKIVFNLEPELTSISSTDPKSTAEETIEINLFENVISNEKNISLIERLKKNEKELKSIYNFYYFDNLYSIKQKLGYILLEHPAEIYFHDFENNELDFAKSFGHTKKLTIECLDVYLSTNNNMNLALKDTKNFYEKYIKNKWKYFTNYQIFQSYVSYLDVVKMDKVQVINYLNTEYKINFDLNKLNTKFIQESNINLKQANKFKLFINNIKFYLIEGDYFTKLNDLTKTPKEIFDNPETINEFISISRYNYGNAQLIRSKIKNMSLSYNASIPNKSVLFEVDGNSKLTTRKNILIQINDNQTIKVHVKWSESEEGNLHNNKKNVFTSFTKILPFIKIKEENPFIVSGLYVRIRIFGIDSDQYKNILEEFNHIAPDLGIETITQAITNNIFYVFPNISTNFPDIYNIGSLESFLFSSDYQEKWSKMKPRAMLLYDTSKMLTINIQNIHSEFELNYFLVIFYNILINYVDIEDINANKIQKLTKLIGGNSKILMNNDPKAFTEHKGIKYSRYCQSKRQPVLIYQDELPLYKEKGEDYRIISMKNQTYGRIDYYLLPKEYSQPNLVKNDITNIYGDYICTLCGSKKQPDKLSSRMYLFKSCIDTMEIKGKPVENIKKLSTNIEMYKSAQKINFGIQILELGKTMLLPKKLINIFSSTYYIKNIELEEFGYNDQNKNGDMNNINIINLLSYKVKNLENFNYIIFNYDKFDNIYIIKPDRYPNINSYYKDLVTSNQIYYFLYFSDLNMIYQIYSQDDDKKLSQEKHKLFKSLINYDTTINNIQNLLLISKGDVKFNNYVMINNVCIGVSLDNDIFFPINKQNKFLLTDIKLSSLHIETKSYYDKIIALLKYEIIDDILIKYLNLGILKVYDFNREILFIPYVMNTKTNTEELFKNITFSVQTVHSTYQESLQKIEKSELFINLIKTKFNYERLKILKKILHNDDESVLLFYEIGKNVKRFFKTFKHLQIFKQLKDEYITILEAETMTKKSMFSFT